MFQLNRQSKEIIQKNKDNEILVSFGSNIGNSSETIGKAIDYLIYSGAVYNSSSSSYFITEPVGYTNQNKFLNLSFRAETDKSPYDILFLFKTLEYFLGRKKRERWHKREIDIDLIIYGNIIINSEYLSLPHKMMHERLFVLLPSMEIASDMYHPLFKKNIEQLYYSYKGNEKVLKAE